MTTLIEMVFRSAVPLALGLALCRVLPRQSAAVRHAILASAVAASILVLPLGLALPQWTVEMPVPSIVAGQLPVADTGVPVVTTTSTTPAGPAAPTAAPAEAGVEGGWMLTLVWLAGAGLSLGWMGIGIGRIGGIASRSTTIDETRWTEGLADVAARFAIRRPIRLSRTTTPDLLATWGLIRPQVLLPPGCESWSTDRIRIVLSHELAHIRRHDWLVQTAAESVRAVLWFNPLAWAVCRLLRRESEQAADDDVLGLGEGPRTYASHLLDLARQFRRPRRAWASALPMAHPSTLERRIAAMLNPALDRRRPSPLTLGTIVATVALMTAPAAMLRAGQSGPAPLGGTIYDVSGGVMPGVEVSVVDSQNTRSTATSNASGRFEFVPMAPGKYVMEVKVPGFKTLRQELTLQAAADWERTITLQVAELSETVTIRSSRSSAAQAGAAGDRAAPIRVGGNIRAPKKVKDVKPVFPESMREAGLTGVVPLEAVIGVDGTVSSVRVLSAQIHPDFALAAADAVRRWQFTPTLLNGKPVPVVMTVTVRFDLE